MKYLLTTVIIGIMAWAGLMGQEADTTIPMIYIDSTGQVFTKTDAPAYIFIAPAENESELTLVPSTDKAANPMEWDGSGKHYIMHKDLERKMNIRFKVMADGTPPKTNLTFSNGLIFRYENLIFTESNAVATLTSTDDMSGVHSTYTSTNSGKFSVVSQPITFNEHDESVFAFYSIDNVGNAETPQEYRVITSSNARVQMDNIYFETNSTLLNSQSTAELQKLLAILKQFPKVVMEIGAHTDSKGNVTYNQQLSERRAQAAVDYLTSRGISKERLTAKGYGETMILNECKKGVECPDSKHKENRRVEFVITKVNAE